MNKKLFGPFKIIRYFLVFCFFILGYQYLGYSLNEGFSSSHIQCKEKNETFSSCKCDAEILSLLNQEFTYMSKGSQSFVFLGEDQKTVLKFFRCNRYFPSHLPLISIKKRELKKMKWTHLMESCSLAYQKLKQESALIFLHLTPTEDLPKLTVKDKLGRKLYIDLNKTYFTLQKKSLLLYEFLEDCKKNNKSDLAKRGIKELIDLIRYRYRNGIGDKNPALAKNVGFIEGRPMFIDIGEFYKINPIDESSLKNELQQMTRKIAPWILMHYPELFSYLQQEIIVN